MQHLFWYYKWRAESSVFSYKFPKEEWQIIITDRNEVVAKVMFLHVSVILSTGGGVLWAPPPPGPGRPPPGPGRPPPRPGRHPRTRQTLPDQADTPPGPGRPPPPRPGRQPPRPDRPPPPRTRQTPPPPRPREEDCSIRSMSGRYASYWNAFLFKINAYPF